MRVSAIIVTRGNVPLGQVLTSLPREWERIIWNNGAGRVDIIKPLGSNESLEWYPVQDMAVYGRYAAIEYASSDLIYVQDDDVVVSSPRLIVDVWGSHQEGVVCNMPEEFRHSFYQKHALVGFGAAFHRSAPFRAFQSYQGGYDEAFGRTCDIVFTALTPRVLVDVPRVNMEHAYAADRMYRQPDHLAERAATLERALAVARA